MKRIIQNLAAFVGVLSGPTAMAQTLGCSGLMGSQIVGSQGDSLENTFMFELGAIELRLSPDISNAGGRQSKWPGFQTAIYPGDDHLQEMRNHPLLFEGMTAFMWLRNSENSDDFLADATNKLKFTPLTFQVYDSGYCANGPTAAWSLSVLVAENPVRVPRFYTRGAKMYDGSSGPYDIQTHVVPEPGIAMMSCLGCAIPLLRNRRR